MIPLDADLDIHPDHVAVNETASQPRKNSPEFDSADLRVNLTKEARTRGLSQLAGIRARLSGDSQPEPPKQNAIQRKAGLLAQLDSELVQRVAQKVAA